jgi:hypothetical protein
MTNVIILFFRVTSTEMKIIIIEETCLLLCHNETGSEVYENVHYKTNNKSQPSIIDKKFL